MTALPSKNYSLGYLLTKSARIVSQMYQQEIQKKGLPVTAPQSGILRVLAQKKVAGQSEIASALHLDKANLSTMVQKLLSAGLIESRKADHDTRRKYLSLTKAGQKVVRDLQHIDSIVENRIQKYLKSSAEEISVREFLYRIYTERPS